MADGTVWRKTETFRVTIVLTLTDCCGDKVPAYAGKMRVAVCIDTDEEEKWVKEVKEWRIANLVGPFAENGAGTIETLTSLSDRPGARTGPKTTINPK